MCSLAIECVLYRHVSCTSPVPAELGRRRRPIPGRCGVPLPASPGDGRFAAAQRLQRGLRRGRGAGAQRLENPSKTALLLKLEVRAFPASRRARFSRCASGARSLGRCGVGQTRKRVCQFSLGLSRLTAWTRWGDLHGIRRSCVTVYHIQGATVYHVQGDTLQRGTTDEYCRHAFTNIRDRVTVCPPQGRRHAATTVTTCLSLHN